MTIKGIAVSSEAATAIGYDEHSQVMRVWYTGGGIYDYLLVPAWEHRRVMTADSIGTYLNQVIKERYPYREVTEVVEERLIIRENKKGERNRPPSR
jgi:hypothetical protein